MNWFITGTDTGVGKTFVSALLIRELRKAGFDSVGFKPICCGGREDAEALCEASGGSVSIDDVNPMWLRTPAAPYTASTIEERTVDLDLIRDTFQRLRREHVSLIVEGVGGWLTPVRRDFFVADLAVEFGLPVVVVVANRLGALNHALLTLADMKARGVACAGIVFNHVEETFDAATTTNRSVLENLMDVPILFEIERGQTKLPLGVA